MKPLDLIISLQEIHGSEEVVNDILRIVVAQLLSHMPLCDPLDCSTPGFPIPYYLLELVQTLVHGVGDAIQPLHPPSLPSPPALIFPSIRVFSNESALHS